MDKSQLRKEILGYLKSYSKIDKSAQDNALVEKLLKTEAYQSAQVIATYLPLPHEFNSHLFIKQAQKDGKVILVPKTYSKGRMIFVAYDSESLIRTSFGLLEPKSDKAVSKADIDMIHVPGLVFNSRGFRVGYGAGYYDRYLSDFQGKTASTIYNFQKVEFDEDSFDVAVEEMISV